MIQKKRLDKVIPDENRKKAQKLFSDEDFGITTLSKKINNHTNDNIDDDYSEEIEDFEVSKKKSKIKTAKEYAMYLVSNGTYTEKKIRIKISQKKIYSSDEIDEAIEYLKSFGYINDLKLAQNSLPSLARRLWGKNKIIAYFIHNGISEDVIDEIDFSDIDFYYYCEQLLLKQKGKSWAKVMRFLHNAGYQDDEINEAIENTGFEFPDEYYED